MNIFKIKTTKLSIILIDTRIICINNLIINIKKGVE